ncbi:hypothetical protein GC169_03165 [bacterium]|nr:hypothetical protein [bacterium]
MRQFIGLIISLYLTVVVIVFGGGVYGFLTDQPTRDYACAPSELSITTPANELEGAPNWIAWAAIRAAIWPKSYLDDRHRVNSPIQWLLVQYDPFPNACR